MKKNLSAIIDNQQDLEKIDSNANDLRFASDSFSQRGRELERKMRWRNKMMLLLMGSGAFVFIILIAYILF